MATSDLREQLQSSLGGTYALGRELGGGGMSRVFVAEETTLGRRVVVRRRSPPSSSRREKRHQNGTTPRHRDDSIRCAIVAAPTPPAPSIAVSRKTTAAKLGAVCLAALAMLAPSAAAQSTPAATRSGPQTINPGELWPDNRGQHIQA